MKSYYLYIISNSNNTVLYIGITNNLQRRIYEHKEKLIESFTEKYNCSKLVYFEEYHDVNEAIRREKQLKNWHKQWKIDLIKQKNPNFRDLLKSDPAQRDDIINNTMKNALILHGLSDNSQVNWFPWVKQELEKIGYKVWVPDLPDADFPKQSTWCNYILNNKDWKFNEESIVIGHSSGAVSALGLIQRLPDVIKHAFLIAAFKDNLKYKGFKELDGLFEDPFDFPKIKKHVNNMTFIHSTDDPYCPLEHASYLAVKTGGRLLIQSGAKHFSESTNPQYKTFPFLLELIKQTT